MTRTWPRANTLWLSIPQADLTDLGVPLTTDDAPAITARAVALDRTTIPGAEVVEFIWDSDRQAWRGLLPYVVAFDAVDQVRVLVDCTVGGTPQRLMDAECRFTLADGR